MVYDWSSEEPLHLSADADEALADPLWGSEQELIANEAKARMFAQLLTKAGLLQGARVLDIGCGRGLFLRACLDSGAASVTGQEFRRSDIAYAQGVLGIEDIRPFETKHTDVWPTDEFDLVCSLDVLEHVHDLRTVFEQCLRVLRPGGHMLHATPGYDSYSHRVGRFLSNHRFTENAVVLAGLLCNVDAPNIAGGHVSTLGRRQLTWLRNTYSLEIEHARYVSSYSYSDEHYATIVPYLRKFPPRIGSRFFALVRLMVKNKLVFRTRAPK